MSNGTGAEQQIARLDYASLTAEAAERLKYQIALVYRGLQGLALVNGGALVAFITMLSGNAGLRVTAHQLWGSFGLFAAGLALALLANLAAFLSQGFYYQATQFEAWDAQRRSHGLSEERGPAILAAHRRGVQAVLGGIATAALSLLAFILGVALALAAVAPR